MPIPCGGCGRSYDDALFASGRTISCTCGRRVGAEPPAAEPRSGEAPRFAVDVMLARLARWLRVLGLDATWTADIADADLVRHAQDEGRWLLTRDRALSEEWRVPRIRLVSCQQPLEQLREIIDAFSLRDHVQLFARCTRCNAPIEALPRDLAEQLVPPRVLARNERFWHCPRCERVYWAGSHADRMRRTIERIVGPDA